MAVAFILSQFLYTSTPATTSPASIVITIPTGEVTSPAIVPNVLNAFPTFPTAVTTFPIVETVLPNTKIVGPIAAAIPAYFIMFFCAASSRLLNASIIPVILSIPFCAGPARLLPMLYVNTSNVDFSFSIEPPTPLNSESAIPFAVPSRSSSEFL